MPLTGILPPLLFSLAFLLPAYWLYRTGRRAISLAPACTALLLAGTTVAIYVNEVRHTQARHDLGMLLKQLSGEELYTTTALRDERETLFLFSTASQALYRGLNYAPEQKEAIDSVLLRMADWTRRASNLSQWNAGTDWDRSVFFLAHAGAVLGHYQLATNDERYAPYFRRIGDYLGQRMARGHYKHLGSSGDESLLRPADNAAAIYVLTLFDAYYGEAYAVQTRREWTDYIKKELYYAESRLPCAAFNVTNRCSLEPSAVATGLYIGYRAASAPTGEVRDDIPYREWLHYFKRFSGSPFSLSIRPNMRSGEVARLCNAGVAPLDCGWYEDAVGLWAAAEYGGGYTYFRLFAGAVFERWFGGRADFGALRPALRVKALTVVALRCIGEGTEWVG